MLRLNESSSIVIRNTLYVSISRARNRPGGSRRCGQDFLTACLKSLLPFLALTLVFGSVVKVDQIAKRANVPHSAGRKDGEEWALEMERRRNVSAT
jgi:hypothetical protein